MGVGAGNALSIAGAVDPARQRPGNAPELVDELDPLQALLE